jgi:uncharacterized repeat protein (TIGR03803 family)
MKTYLQPRVLARVLALVLSAVGMVSAPLPAQAQTFKVIYSFTGSPDGGNPGAEVTLDAAGNLYGTTAFGGVPGCYMGAGCGTVFQLTSTSGGWAESVLYAFTGGTDGASPEASVIFDKVGNLYGTANYGGTAGCGFGNGVAFELSPGSGGWTETVLYSFGGAGGCEPVAALVFDKGGNLYSTLPNGGRAGVGVAYELTKGTSGWKETILYSFGYTGTSGSEPVDAPILDAAGNLYGTTSCCNSRGAVWELLHGSWKEKTLYTFNGLEGSPFAGLVFDKAGNLYGTTRGGGKYSAGTVFKLAPLKGGEWKETVLHSFKGGSDGKEPFSTPILDKAGNLYGTTSYGGSTCNCGTVFKLTPSSGGRWKEKVLHRFAGGSDGSVPESGLAVDAADNLYGTTLVGGNAGCYGNLGCGVVFEITP